jgi:hypothetical protein
MAMIKKSLLIFFLPMCLPAQSTPNVSGFWELTFDSRYVPLAELTPQAASADRSMQAKHDAASIRWCHYFGVPFVMDQTPIDIIQNLNGKEIGIVFPVRSPGRHIYTDGRPHVSPDVFDPVSNGHSIGHWEGDTLVVDTVGFSDEGVLAIPGGGRRGAGSHLVERYTLMNKGETLSVVSVWEDPEVFAKPHRYEFRYRRMPKGTEAREFDCDASDPERTKFLTGASGN